MSAHVTLATQTFSEANDIFIPRNLFWEVFQRLIALGFKINFCENRKDILQTTNYASLSMSTNDQKAI